MKTIIALLLCVSILNISFAQTNPPCNCPTNAPASDGDIGPKSIICWWTGLAVLTMGVVGTCMVLYVHWKADRVPHEGQLVTYVLKESLDHVNWTPVATNTTIFHTNQPPKEIFRRQNYMRDDSKFYKIDCIGR